MKDALGINWYGPGGGAPTPATPNEVSGRAELFTASGGNDWAGRGNILDASALLWLCAWRESTGHTDNGVGQINLNLSADEGDDWGTKNAGITGFPYTANITDATGTADFQLIKLPNGSFVMVTHERDTQSELASWKSFGLVRGTSAATSWAFDYDLGQLLVDGAIIANKTRIWACYDHFVHNNDVFFAFSEHQGDLTSARNLLCKTPDNFDTVELVSVVVDYDEAPTPIFETGIVDFSNGDILWWGRGNQRTFLRISSNGGQTWGTLTEVTFAMGNVGIDQPRLRRYGKLIIGSGRDIRATNLKFTRNAIWPNHENTWRALGSIPFVKVDLDDDYLGTNVDNAGDTGYATVVKKSDDSFYAVGGYGTSVAGSIFKYDIAAGTAETEHKQNLAFDPSTINAGFLRLQMNRDSVKAANGTTYVHRDLSTGAFTVTGAVYVLDGVKGWFDFNGSSRVVATTVFGNTLFRDSFSAGMWLKPDDGQPAAAGVLVHDVANLGSVAEGRVQIFLNIDGTFRVLYSIGGTTVSAFTEAAVFPNGATVATHVAVTFTSGELIRIYANGVLQPLVPDPDETPGGDISGLTMASYTNTTNPLRFGQRLQAPGTNDLGYAGLMRELEIMPVVWDTDDIANLMLN
jgi:hypothetical protein